MNRLIVLALMFSPTSAVVVGSLMLVNTSTGKDIMEIKNGSVINRKKHGQFLTLRANVAGKGCVSMVLDNSVERAINQPPYYLAGTSNNGEIFPSNSLQQLGEHKLTLRPCRGGKPIKVARGAGRPKGEIGREVDAGYATVGIGGALTTSTGEGGVRTVDETLQTGTTGGYGTLFNTTNTTGASSSSTGSEWVTMAASLFGGKNRMLEEEHAEAHRRNLAFRLKDDEYWTIWVTDDDRRPAASVTLPSSQIPAYDHDVFGAVTGELRKWHKVTLGFDGPPTSEFGMTQPGVYEKPSPFPDYRCDVIFSQKSKGKSYTVPCYYAGNGDAANGAIENGNVWLAHFCPDEEGVWSWTAEFKQGTNVAQNGGGDSAGFFDNVSGSFNIDPTNKKGRDLRSKGRLQYTGEHYLKFAQTGEYFIKAGPDSPSNFLAYEEFDGTPDNGGYRKSYNGHVKDYISGQFTWNGDQGRGIIGALNYLAKAGMNVLTVNLISDDGNVFPWSSRASTRKTDFDISKLAQWEIVFEQAEKLGITLHMKFQETDNDTAFQEPPLEEHNMSEQRKIFYREMIARFGHHLGVTWNLGRDQLHPEYLIVRSAYIRKVDPYNSPILVQDSDSASMLSSLLGVDTIEGASIHCRNDVAQVETLEWIYRSALMGRKWVVSVDQQADVNEGVKPDSSSNMDVIREKVLYGNLMAGGAGVQYFFGLSFTDSDLDAETFQSRANVWQQSKYALKFFGSLPLAQMSNQNGWLIENGTDSILASNDGKTIVYYKASTSTTQIMDFPNNGQVYSLTWFNPRTGERSKRASTVRSGFGVTLPKPPSQRGQKDLVALMTCTLC